MTIVFTGDDNVDIGNASYSVPLTLSCWIRTPNTVPTTGWYTAIGYGNSVDNDQYVILGYYSNGSTIQFYASFGDNSTNYLEFYGDALSTNTKYHIAAKFENDDFSSYVTPFLNGTPLSGPVGFSTINPTLDTAEIGCVFGSSLNYYFIGEIAEAAVWNYGLTRDPITSMYNGFSPLFYPSGLQWYNPLWSDNAGRLLWGERASGTVPTDNVDNYPTIYPSWLYGNDPQWSPAMATGTFKILDKNDNVLLGPFHVPSGTTKTLKLGYRVPKGVGPIKVVLDGLNGGVDVRYHKRKG